MHGIKAGKARILAGLFALCLMTSSCVRGSVPASMPPTTTTAAPTTTTTVAPTTTTRPTLPADAIAAPSAVLYDYTDDCLLFSKGADESRYPASTTKLLTAIVALLYCDEDEEVAVTQEALDFVMYDASRARLEAGMRLTLRTALEALLLPSGGDAAYVIAEHVGRRLEPDRTLTTKEAVDIFCEEMNRIARALGAQNSHFINPDGYPNTQHTSTAYDILLIAREAYTFATIREIVATPSVTRTLLSGETITWNNPNRQLQPDSPYYYPGVNGMKSGYSSESGFCMTTSCEKNGKTYLVVILKSPSDEQKWQDIRTLLDAC